MDAELDRLCKVTKYSSATGVIKAPLREFLERFPEARELGSDTDTDPAGGTFDTFFLMDRTTSKIEGAGFCCRAAALLKQHRLQALAVIGVIGATDDLYWYLLGCLDQHLQHVVNRGSELRRAVYLISAPSAGGLRKYKTLGFNDDARIRVRWCNENRPLLHKMFLRKRERN